MKLEVQAGNLGPFTCEISKEKYNRIKGIIIFLKENKGTKDPKIYAKCRQLQSEIDCIIFFRKEI